MTAAPTLLLPRVAAVLEAHGESELAAEVIEFHEGRKGEHTEHNLALAELWCRIDDRIRKGEAEGDVLADEAESNRLKYDSICGLWALDGRPAIRKILKEWGKI
jgi:hypothetical protein